ncbi:hypothetical protein GG344DRAFT_83513 [Lentinula edodes]|nr:hypothetical protein GG344DRAFT_83513 [Lentinula edodes]
MKTPPKPSAPDKRPRPRQDNDDDSDDEDNDYLFEGDISVGVGGVTGTNGNRKSTGRFKREYLLTQIRQKDMIIESLLKEKFNNPYVATPLSIASYRMATSPSDSSNNNVLAWLDRLRTSVQDAGGKAGPVAFTDVCFSGNGGDMDDEDDEDDEGEDHDRSGGRWLTHAQRIGLVPVHEGNDCETRTDLNEENLDDDNVGVANATYFVPGPATDLDIRASFGRTFVKTDDGRERSSK